HSTKINNCCFIESQTSLMLANRLFDKSPSPSYASSSAAPK
ncbi:AAEL011327-PA, partial [Aedes aegypti]